MTAHTLTPEIFGDFDAHLAAVAAGTAHPQVIDDNLDCIFVRWRGKTLRTWRYDTDAERRRAREVAAAFCAGVQMGMGR